jgi:hypothetical protein
MKCCQWLPADHYVSQCYSVCNVVSDFQQIFMFHSVTLYAMLSVTFSRSLCFTVHWQHCIQSNTVKHKDLLKVTDNIAYRVTLWNIKICWKSLTTLHTRSICFTALICMKCCQWLPADCYVSQRYSVCNVVSDFQQIFMFHSVTLYEILSHWQHFIQSNAVKHKDLLEVTDNISYRVMLWNIKICWKLLTTFHTE